MLNSNPAGQHLSLNISEDKMQGCSCPITHLQRATFPHSQAQSHEAGAALKDVAFLQTWHLQLSHMGSYSAMATMHFPAAAGQAEEPVQQQDPASKQLCWGKVFEIWKEETTGHCGPVCQQTRAAFQLPDVSGV